jgi:anti-sigma factor RsiW
MKPCPKNRERIALLAMDALEVQRRRELLAHLDSCPGCRCYLEEISGVARKLHAAETETETDARPSPLFHRNVVAALAAAERRSPMLTLVAQVRSLWNWRLILPAAAAAALVIAAWFPAMWHADAPIPSPLVVDAVVPPDPQPDLAPTFSNYKMAAHQSLDKLDALLTEQGQRNPPPSPAYSAGRVSSLDTSD